MNTKLLLNHGAIQDSSQISYSLQWLILMMLLVLILIFFKSKVLLIYLSILKEVFQMLKTASAPQFIHFPRKGKPKSADFFDISRYLFIE